MNPSSTLFARDALLPDGWARDVLLQWDDRGRLRSVQPGGQRPANVAEAVGPVLPGMPNLHSHAFQRAFGGLTEYRGQAQDSFWSWRSLMYRFAAAITPQQLEAVAGGLYVEMLEAGYTSVCEFHYVHHDVDGRPYADDTELSQCLLRAAARAGIGFTLLPVLYQTSGFGGTAPREDQRRFIRSTASMLRLLERLRPLCEAQGARLGLAPHSLRAVPPASLADSIAGLTALDATAPIHIHLAEQTAEVDACLAWSGQRPVQWLLEHAPVDQRWCLVHATHMTPAESERAARSGAVAGLCPTTEANLGDGLFDAGAWRAAGGRWGLGSDSHATVNAAEELLMLEYGQRLRSHQRNVLAGDQHRFVATALTLEAVAGGAQAAGRPVAGLAAGQQADFVVLDAEHPLLQGLPSPDTMLSAHVFASHRQSAIAAVWVAGRPVVAGGRHPLRAEAGRAFAAARSALARSGFDSH
ncbi:formimidoylglutamate deiminase [Ramlibacter sp.]|uniref:formimidoylglutamate deiminase n=1 Tax=Ramlibacter sp. TaxID=1917967 RepID=UPI002CC7D421|nr:formimidoylglutamate deiminase [Ramlibacter sp.]HWI83821.1 formimidoylglutamate deiminase [Ramlibacter sp.]